jgi:hypothetical protein
MDDNDLLILIISSLDLFFVRYLSTQGRSVLHQFCSMYPHMSLSKLYKNFISKVKPRLPRNICGPTIIYRVTHPEGKIFYLFGELHYPLDCNRDIRGSSVIKEMCDKSCVPITLLIEDTPDYENSYLDEQIRFLRNKYDIDDDTVEKIEENMDIVTLRDMTFPSYVTKIPVDIRDLHLYPGLAAEAYFRYNFPPEAVDDFLSLCCDPHFDFDNYILNLESKLQDAGKVPKHFERCKSDDFSGSECRIDFQASQVKVVARKLQLPTGLVKDDSYKSLCKLVETYFNKSFDTQEEQKEVGEEILKLFSESTVSIPLITHSLDYYAVQLLKSAENAIFYGGENHTNGIVDLLENEGGYHIEEISRIEDDYFPLQRQ